MKATLLLLVPILLAGGCRKHDEDTPPQPSALPSTPLMCSATVTNYAGATVLGSCSPQVGNPCQDHYQTVVVNADVIDHPTDVVDVHLCHGSDCTTTMPSANIQLGHNTVTFLNAFPQYDSYKIQTTVCR